MGIASRFESVMRTFIFFSLFAFCVVTHSSLTKEDVKAAIDEGERIVKMQKKKESDLKSTAPVFESQKANEDSNHEQEKGHILLAATKILVDKLGKGILPELSKFEVEELVTEKVGNREKRSNKCPQENTNCFGLENAVFRSITGLCNNRDQKDLGKSVSPYRRLLGRDSYSDGFSEIRKAASGGDLPSARLISNVIHNENNRISFDSITNHFHMQYGQFIAHDLTFMPAASGPNKRPLDCSSCESAQISGNCLPIPVPTNDQYFPRNGCIRFTRAVTGQRGLGARSQINQNTHFLDLSAVYGSEPCEAASLRSFRDGLLLEQNHRGSILPPKKIEPLNDTVCQSRAPNLCFLAGDFRNSLQPGLIPLHAVYIKEHNRIAKLFKKAVPQFDDERIYQETRRIMIARHQHHIYNEYLPKLLSTDMRRKFDLIPQNNGHVGGYNSSVDASLTSEFAAGAFRVGHAQARSDIPRVNNNNEAVSSAVPLGRNFFYAESLYQTSQGGAEAMLHGMMLQPAMQINALFSFPMRNQLFEIRGRRASGVDLAAVNIQRGRDAGLLPYNDYRVAAGLRRASNFDDLRDVMDANNIATLRTVYQNVTDIDLYTGMLLERAQPGGMMGITGSHIIAETFSALKKGDRFFYEFQIDRSRAFTPEELAMVKKSKINKMYCSVTSDMLLVPREVFSLNTGRVPCSSIENVDIAPFVAAAKTIRL